MELINKIQTAVTTRNDTELSKLLIIKWGNIAPEQAEISASATPLFSSTLRLSSDWSGIISLYIACLQALKLGSDGSDSDYMKAYDAAKGALRQALQGLARPEEYRLSVRALINNAQSIAHRARDYAKTEDDADRLLAQILGVLDPELSKLLKVPEKLSGAQSQLALTIGIACTTIASALRKQQIVSNTLELLRPLIVSRGSVFPKSDMVSFNYFKGSLNVTSDADKYACLRDAFDHCLRGSPNKRVILRSLVAAALVLRRDVYPAPRLLEKYALTDAYAGILGAVARGNPVLFDRELERNVAVFAEWGLYFTVVKARFKLWRNVCRFAQNYVIAKGSKRTDAVPFNLIRNIVKITTNGECVVEDEELECILANTIAMGYVNGSLFENASGGFLILDISDPFNLRKHN